MNKKTFFIISGGMLEEKLIMDYYKNTVINNRELYKIVAVDKGLEYVTSLGIEVDYVVGDFDTVNKDIITNYKESNDISNRATIIEFQPEKDLTDTHIAVKLAIDKGADSIVIFGATGGRIDHLLANIALLSIALDNGIKAEIIDNNNKIYLIDKGIKLVRDRLFGRYVSLLAYYYDVKGLTLKGFKYPLSNHRLLKDDSLGISNEVVEDIAYIEVGEGRLIVVESKD